MRIAIIAAGAGGMYCGSCLKDNALAAALHARGHDCRLIPTYTPLTLDEEDVSRGPVFLGGVNVYLDEKPWLRILPRYLRRWADSSPVLRFAGRFVGRTPYSEFGALTLSMLRGEAGPQRWAITELAEHLSREAQPDVVLLTNLLLSAIAPAIKNRLNVPVLASLQGDDVFLDALRPGDRSAAIALVRANAAAIDGHVSTSATYADHMAAYLGLPRDRIDTAWPGINHADFEGNPARDRNAETVIGYFARIDPAKGLDRLVTAFVGLSRRGLAVRLRISGYLAPMYRSYLAEQLARCREAGLSERVEHVDSPSRGDKVRFLQSLDVFCVPARIVEPKALYLLEAMSCGVPVVAPRRGIFPEILDTVAGGLLVEDADHALEAGIERLVRDADLRLRLGEAGREGVREHFSADAMARRTELVLTRHARLAGKLA